MNRSTRKHSRRKWTILAMVLLLGAAGYFGWRSVRRDNEARISSLATANELKSLWFRLYDYRRQHREFPNSLGEVGIEANFVYAKGRNVLVYNPDPNYEGKHWTLADDGSARPLTREELDAAIDEDRQMEEKGHGLAIKSYSSSDVHPDQRRDCGIERIGGQIRTQRRWKGRPG